MQKIRGSLKPVYIFIFVVLLIGVGFVIAEFDQFSAALQKADWRAIPGAVFFTLFAYFSMSVSFGLVCRLFLIQMRLRDTAEIGFVTNVINHVITTGGVAGLSLRFILMGRRGVQIRDSIAASMMHFYLASLDMMVMLPVGLIYLMQNAQVSQGFMVLLGTLAAVLFVFTLLATAIIFQPDLRQFALNTIEKITSLVTRRDLQNTFSQFDKSMRRGIQMMRKNPLLVLAIISLTIADWIASVIVLSFCLTAFGPTQPFGVVMTGFVIGIMVGLASMVPGGLGIQEGSMIWVFVLLGVPFGQALLASILFRAVFFFLPYLVSLLFYQRLLKPGEPQNTFSMEI